MQVKELIAWVSAAQDRREASWKPAHKCYSLTLNEAIGLTKPEGAHGAEQVLAEHLIHIMWNEVIDLHFAFKENEKLVARG